MIYDFDKITHLLSIKSNREILKSIMKKEKRVKDIYLTIDRSLISYRESIYKALEKLVKAGLVEKRFKEGNVYYKSKFNKIIIDFTKEELNMN